MTKSEAAQDRSRPTMLRWLTSPPGRLAIVLAAAAVLSALPGRLVEPLRSAWRSLLRPAQVVTSDTVAFVHSRSDRLQASWASGEQLVERDREIAALRDENRRLLESLEAARLNHDDSQNPASASPTERLLRAEAVEARVLGQTAQTFLRGRDLLDFGARNGATRGALVIDGDLASGVSGGDRNGAILDAGADLGLRAGRLVLAGRRVWGKLAAVGHETSVVERLTDRGYRDTVQVVRRDGAGGGESRFGPRGMLAGNGEPVCRIEMIETTEPVAVGDEVWTIADSVVTSPLVYGRIVRVERPTAGSHWQIWMAPAIGSEIPQRVAVLKLELNGARVAKQLESRL
jgi:cell shape-determining protein MreC